MFSHLLTRMVLRRHVELSPWVKYIYTHTSIHLFAPGCSEISFDVNYVSCAHKEKQRFINYSQACIEFFIYSSLLFDLILQCGEEPALLILIRKWFFTKWFSRVSISDPALQIRGAGPPEICHIEPAAICDCVPESRVRPRKHFACKYTNFHL